MELVNALFSLLEKFDTNTILLIVGFDVLLIATFCRRGGFTLLKRRKRDDWILDLSGLFVQGTLIPWLQIVIVIALMAAVFPDLAGSLTWHPLAAFAFCFVVVDYGYYWNHRLFHNKKLWAIHKVHHTAPQMDVIVTSRNTLWTSFLIVYLWINGVMLYLLADPAAYLLAVTLTAVLDVWRHSTLQPVGILKNILGSVLILPNDHAWHHSQDVYDVNFGANLNVWDKLHGSWYVNDAEPARIGLVLEMSVVSKLWWPFR